MGRKLEVEIVGDARSLNRALGSAESSTKGLADKTTHLGKVGLAVAGAAGLGALIKTVHVGIGEYTEHQKVAAQTNAVIKSTGAVAGISAEHVGELATSIMKKTGIDDEAIQTNENLLLSFTKIRNEAGKGNDVFDRATKVIQDYSVRTGKSAAGATVAFGKALQDPVKGLGALSRAGIILTDSQKKMLKSMVESGHQLDAQKFLLKELESRYGGAAEAAGKTLPGQINIAKESFKNFTGELVAKSIPYIERTIAALRDHWPEIRAAFQQAWGSIKPILTQLGQLAGTVAQIIKDHWGTIGPIVRQVARVIQDMARIIAIELRIITAILRGDWGEAWKQMKALVTAQIRLVVDYVKQELMVLKAVFQGIAASIRAAAGAAGAAMSALAHAVVNALRSGLQGIGNLVASALASIHSAIRRTAGSAYRWAQEIGLQIVYGVVQGIQNSAHFIAEAAANAARHALTAAKHFLHIGSPSKLFADEVGKPISDGIAAGIKAGETAVINALRRVLMAALRARNFGTVSSVIQQMLSAKQAAVRTPAEKQIATIERARQLKDLNKGISDAAADLAKAQHDLAVAMGTGDTAGAAEASARIKDAQDALDRANEDKKLFYLQEAAAKQRAALDAKQMEQQMKLSLTLDRLNLLFENHKVTQVQLLRAIRAILHKLRIPGFASGVRNFSGGAAIVGERGPELVHLPGGSSVTPNSALGFPSVIQLVLPDGRVLAEAAFDPMRSKTQQFFLQTGRSAFA